MADTIVTDVQFIDDAGNLVPVQTSGQPSTTDDLVDAWFVETFHNLALPTELQNRLGEARDTLKARLRAKET